MSFKKDLKVDLHENETKHIDDRKESKINNDELNKRQKIWLINRQKIKSILEDENPELDKPILVNHYYRELKYYREAVWGDTNHPSNPNSRYPFNEPVTKREKEQLVMTERILKLCNLLEQMRSGKTNDEFYKKSNSIPNKRQKEEMELLSKKVEDIYSGQKPNEKCVAVIGSLVPSDHDGYLSKYYPQSCDDVHRETEDGIEYFNTGLTDKPEHRRIHEMGTQLPCAGIMEVSHNRFPELKTLLYLQGVDTTYKGAMLANLSSDYIIFEYIIQNPEMLQKYSDTLNEIPQRLQDDVQEEKETGSSKITFATIKSAIKEHLLGKGER